MNVIHRFYFWTIVSPGRIPFFIVLALVCSSVTASADFLHRKIRGESLQSSRSVSMGELAETMVSVQFIKEESVSRGEQFYQQGKIHLKQNQFNLAIDDFTSAMNNGIHTANILIRRGDAYSELKQYEKAIEDFTESLRLESKNSIAYALRGEAYYYTKRYHEAIDDISRAIIISPKGGILFSMRAGIYLATNEAEKALKDLDKAIALGQVSTPVLHDKGLALMRLDRYQEALKSFSAAIKLQPNDRSSLLNRAYLYLCLQEYDEALVDDNTLLSLDPSDVGAIRQRVSAYNGKNQYSVALSDLNRLVELGSKDSWVYLMFGEVFYNAGEEEKALLANKEAIALDLDGLLLGELYLQKGFLLLTSGMAEEALEAYRESLIQKNLSSDNFDYAIQRIRNTSFVGERAKSSSQDILKQLEEMRKKVLPQIHTVPYKCHQSKIPLPRIELRNRLEVLHAGIG